MPTRSQLAHSDFSALLESVTTRANSRAYSESFLLDLVISHLALYHEARLPLTEKQLAQLLRVFDAVKLAR